MTAPTRRAFVASTDTDVISRYLPANYHVVALHPDPDNPDYSGLLIEGQDNAGWTLDDYVLPRLASGLYFGKEIPVGPAGPSV